MNQLGKYKVLFTFLERSQSGNTSILGFMTSSNCTALSLSDFIYIKADIIHTLQFKKAL